MSRYYHGRQLGEALVKEGLVPGNCADVELLMPVDGAVTLRCNLLIDEADIHKLLRAVASVAGQPIQGAREEKPAILPERCEGMPPTRCAMQDDDARMARATFGNPTGSRCMGCHHDFPDSEMAE